MEMENSSFLCPRDSFTRIFFIITAVNLILYFFYYIYQLFSSSILNDQRSKEKYSAKTWIKLRDGLRDLLTSFSSFCELLAMFRLKLIHGDKSLKRDDLNQLALILNDRDFCYRILNRVSRSFSMVIEQLPEQLKDVVCVFYLILRGLDSIEDDMNYPNEQKISLLKDFHLKLFLSHWSIEDVGDQEDYRILLKYFDKVIHQFQSLNIKYQSIIIDITRRMGDGMARFVHKENSIQTSEDYHLYCHYVAGLVGIGLSSLFTQSGLEEKILSEDENCSNSMGLFLQKTNIIRDYFEDLQAGRTWWPKEIWSNYVDDLCDFVNQPNDGKSVQCLNEMVLNCLSHLPDVIKYLRRLRNIRIFEFCSIPQVMALATLTELYQNPLVFTSAVKIRQGLTCRIILNSSRMNQVDWWMTLFLTKIEEKIPSTNRHSIDEQIYQLIQRTRTMLHSQ